MPFNVCRSIVRPIYNNSRINSRPATLALDFSDPPTVFEGGEVIWMRALATIASATGYVMMAQIIAAWAMQNGFNLLDSWKYRRSDDTRTITIEIKKLSVVLIDERVGSRPRIVSSLFKDLFFGSPNSKLEQLLLDR